MLKIGVDAQMLCRSVTGIERYAYEMLHEMVRLYPEVHFFLYAPNDIQVDLGSTDNVTVRSAGMHFRGAGALCCQVQLPYWANSDCVDVVWGPGHRLPRLLSNSIARVLTIHDLIWKRAGETMRFTTRMAENVFVPSAIRSADIVVADSQSTANDIAAEFPEVSGRVRVVHLGATKFPAPGDCETLRKFGIAGRYLLFVGTLEPRKNLKRLLEAYASLNSEARARCNLVIAGGKGWGNEDLSLLIQSLDLAESVKLTGYVSDYELATLYSHALFLAIPSLYEGFGLPLVEAMTFGVPVLTSRMSSLPEVAGDAGILVDPESVTSIADGLLKFISDDELRNKLASKAVNNASRFSWESAANELMRIFNEAVNARRKRKHLG